MVEEVRWEWGHAGGRSRSSATETVSGKRECATEGLEGWPSSVEAGAEEHCGVSSKKPTWPAWPLARPAVV